MQNILKEFIEEHKADFTKYVLYTLSFPLSEVALPHMYGKVIKSLSESRDVFKNNKYNFITIGLLWGVVMFLGWNKAKLNARFIPEMKSYFKNKYIEMVLKHHSRSSKELPIGEMLVNIIRLATVLEELMHLLVVYLLPLFLVVIFATAYMFTVDPRLGVFMAAGMSILFGIARLSLSSCSDEIKENSETFDKLHEDIADILSNTENIYAVGQIQEEVERVYKESRKYCDSSKKSRLCTSRFKIIFTTLYSTFIASFAGYTFKLYKDKELDIGQVSSVMVILTSLIGKLDTLSGELKELVYQYNQYKNLGDIIEKMKSDTTETKESFSLSAAPSVLFVDLAAGYPGKRLFENFTLQIKPATCTVINGQIGSGKSTLIKTLLKLHPIESGDILIDGIRLSNISADELRENIAYIQQNPRLFNRTVAENILYGTDATREKLVSILNSLKVDTLKESDLDRLAGKGGGNLSGGQKQIALLIRAILRDSKLVLLDEPTASLSSSTKESLMRVLRRMKASGDKTIIIVSHDPDLNSLADRTVRLG